MGKRLHPEVQAPFPYKLHQNIHNQYRGDITEKVVYTFFEHEEIPRLKSQGWDMAFLTKVRAQANFMYYAMEAQEIRSLVSTDNLSPSHFKDLQTSSIAFFRNHGIFPSKQLNSNYIKLLNIVKTQMPDGFLFKIKKIDELTHKELRKKYRNVNGLDEFYASSIDGVEKLIPIVDGEIELIEIKSNKDTLAQDDKHRLIYRECLSEGFMIRWYNVEIVSFEKNEFNITLRIYIPKEAEG